MTKTRKGLIAKNDSPMYRPYTNMMYSNTIIILVYSGSSKNEEEVPKVQQLTLAMKVRYDSVRSGSPFFLVQTGDIFSFTASLLPIMYGGTTSSPKSLMNDLRIVGGAFAHTMNGAYA